MYTIHTGTETRASTLTAAFIVVLHPQRLWLMDHVSEKLSGKLKLIIHPSTSLLSWKLVR